MFLERNQRPSSDGYDAIVIGSGPAGMTVAMELDDAGRRVLLLESEYGDGDPALSIGYGSLSGDYWNAHWLRALGGTSAAWAGWVATLREIDFDHPNAGASWPITRADLDPYYRRAAPIINRHPTVFDFERAVVPGWLHRPFSLQPPTRFGERYYGTLSRSKRIDVALGYSAVGFDATRSRSALTAVHLFDHRTKTRFSLPVRATQAVVVAAGGIGNAQLLLQPTPDGPPIGNESGHVGKYLMEHPHVYGAGECVTDLNFGRYAPPGRFGRAAPALVPDNALEAEHQLLGCSLEFDRPTTEGPVVAQWSTPDRRFTLYRLVVRSEMRPTAANSVEITAEESQSGLHRVAARCVFDADDLRNIENTIRLLGETLIRLNRGRVRVNNDAIYRDATGGGHIMGTTRMGRTPSSSVVNEHCRVHGYRNFFVAGSSVFPTAGYANPTFTIVALAVRLADDLVRSAGSV